MVSRKDTTLLSIAEAAELLTVSKTVVLKLADQGYLVPDNVIPTQSGRLTRRKFKKDAVESFFKSCVKTSYHGEELMTITDVINELGVSHDVIYYYVKMGWLTPDIVFPSLNIGKRGLIRFKRDTIDAFVDRMINGQTRWEMGVTKLHDNTLTAFSKYQRNRRQLCG